MKNIEEIIHMDDWKRSTGINYKSYTEQEIKVILRRYAEECVGELWKNVRSYIDSACWYEAKNAFEDIEKEIARQVII